MQHQSYLKKEYAINCIFEYMLPITKKNSNPISISSFSVWKYALIFLGWFIVFYWGTKMIWGLTTPYHLYVPFIDHYFNYIALNRDIVLAGSRKILESYGYYIYSPQPDILIISGEYGVILNYSCLGFAVMSFWLALVITHHGKWWFKALWAVIGIAIIIAFNIARVSLVLISGLEKWQLPFGLDHHTWFNIVTYLAILVLALLYNYTVNRKFQS